MFKILICILIAYLLGNISGAIIFGKILFNKDIRKYGSKNAGTTNALRVFGLKVGILTFLIDFFKAILACFFGFLLLGVNGVYLSAIFVVLGHNFPVFLNFKGGKGIACSFGFIVFFDYKLAFITLLFFILIVFFTRYISLASMLSTIFAICLCFIFGYRSIYLFLTLFLLSILSIFRHKENIIRLINKKENKISLKNRKKA